MHHRAFMFALIGIGLPATVIGQGVSAASRCPDVLPEIVSGERQPCGFKCGTERWQVKTLTDRDRGSVDFNVRRSTVAALGRLARPARRPADARAGVHERRVYCVEAWIVDEPNSQDDGDMHVVLRGVEDGRSTMVAEFPDVRCAVVCTSGFARAFAAARQQLEGRLKTWNTDTLRVVIVGVGFFDRNHGQYGAAPNFFELHPVLAIRFP